MSVSVLFSGTLKLGEKDGFTEFCREAFKVTRAYDGCQTIDLTYHTENENNWVFTEIWDSKKHYERYVAFRVEDGTVDRINSLCEEAPLIKIYDIVHV